MSGLIFCFIPDNIAKEIETIKLVRRKVVVGIDIKNLGLEIVVVPLLLRLLRLPIRNRLLCRICLLERGVVCNWFLPSIVIIGRCVV